MKTLMKAGCALLCLLAVSTISVAADSSDLDSAAPVMGAGGSGGLTAVAGWSMRSYYARADQQTCINTGYGNQCWYPTVVKTEMTHKFGQLASQTVKSGSHLPDRRDTFVQQVCPSDTTQMKFPAGFTRGNGNFLPGPAYICARM